MGNELTTPKVIILKGSPGIGKSYTARKLISKTKKKKIALISIDEILHFDQRRLCEDKLKLAKFHTAIIVRSFLREGFDVIVEYTFDILEHLQFMVEKIKHRYSEQLPETKIYIFHLTATIEEVIKRNKNRRDGSDPLPDHIVKKLYTLCEATAGKSNGEVLINTNTISVKEVVGHILEAIN